MSLETTARHHEAATRQTTALAGLCWGMRLMQLGLQTGQAAVLLLLE
jgi:hypothetical protein